MHDVAAGVISFIEIGSGGDAASARAFFGAVFDWPCRNDMWLQTPSMKAGVHGGDPAPQVYVFFNVTDMQAAIARVRAAGGEAGEPREEPGFGVFSTCRDPGGMYFGLHELPQS
jgi:predicted enzyme related to lactoylglutathione lyase